jgi:SAM-dependent methyltransferase
VNPYQRIPGEQDGHIDTKAKFGQMTDGLDLNGLTVLDVGCNLGEMTRLLARVGAVARGIDVEVEFVRDAGRLTAKQFVGKNELAGRTSFAVEDGARATGAYDLAIVSATFHYFTDPARFLRQLARISARVRVDVWLADVGHTKPDSPQAMFLSERGLWIPDREAFHYLASQSFAGVAELGTVLSPDRSVRYLYELIEPTADPPRTVLIYGGGGTGKTTRARELSGLGFEHLQLDAIFLEWSICDEHYRRRFSIPHRTRELRGETWSDYIDHARGYLRRWLSPRRGLDVVIEGWSAIDPDYRAMIDEELARFRRENVEEVAT